MLLISYLNIVCLFAAIRTQTPVHHLYRVDLEAYKTVSVYMLGHRHINNPPALATCKMTVPWLRSELVTTDTALYIKLFHKPCIYKHMQRVVYCRPRHSRIQRCHGFINRIGRRMCVGIGNIRQYCYALCRGPDTAAVYHVDKTTNRYFFSCHCFNILVTITKLVIISELPNFSVIFFHNWRKIPIPGLNTAKIPYLCRL